MLSLKISKAIPKLVLNHLKNTYLMVVLFDEDITTLDMHEPASLPSFKSLPSWTASSVRIQPTCLYQNSDIFLIRHPNKAFLDALESWWQDASFCSGPSSRNLVDHYVWPQKSAVSLVLGLFRPCIVSGFNPILWCPVLGCPTLGRPWFPYKLSSRHHLDLSFV